MENVPRQRQAAMAVIAHLAVLLVLPPAGRAAVGPPRDGTAEPPVVGSAPATPVGLAPEPRPLTWPTEADRGILHLLPIPNGFAILVDTKLVGRVDRVITLRGAFAASPSYREALGAVMYGENGLALLLYRTTQAFVFTLGKPMDPTWIAARVPTGFALTVEQEPAEVARYVGDFGSSSEEQLLKISEILEQDPGPPPPNPGCASQCSISCRDGSSSTCSAGPTGCCSCWCPVVLRAQCTH